MIPHNVSPQVKSALAEVNRRCNSAASAAALLSPNAPNPIDGLVDAGFITVSAKVLALDVEAADGRPLPPDMAPESQVELHSLALSIIAQLCSTPTARGRAAAWRVAPAIVRVMRAAPHDLDIQTHCAAAMMSLTTVEYRTGQQLPLPDDASVAEVSRSSADAQEPTAATDQALRAAACVPLVMAVAREEWADVDALRLSGGLALCNLVAPGLSTQTAYAAAAARRVVAQWHVELPPRAQWPAGSQQSLADVESTAMAGHSTESHRELLVRCGVPAAIVAAMASVPHSRSLQRHGAIAIARLAACCADGLQACWQAGAPAVLVAALRAHHAPGTERLQLECCAALWALAAHAIPAARAALVHAGAAHAVSTLLQRHFGGHTRDAGRNTALRAMGCELLSWLCVEDASAQAVAVAGGTVQVLATTGLGSASPLLRRQRHVLRMCRGLAALCLDCSGALEHTPIATAALCRALQVWGCRSAPIAGSACRALRHLGAYVWTTQPQLVPLRSPRRQAALQAASPQSPTTNGTGTAEAGVHGLRAAVRAVVSAMAAHPSDAAVQTHGAAMLRFAAEFNASLAASWLASDVVTAAASRYSFTSTPLLPRPDLLSAATAKAVQFAVDSQAGGSGGGGGGASFTAIHALVAALNRHADAPRLVRHACAALHALCSVAGGAALVLKQVVATEATVTAARPRTAPSIHATWRGDRRMGARPGSASSVSTSGSAGGVATPPFGTMQEPMAVDMGAAELHALQSRRLACATAGAVATLARVLRAQLDNVRVCSAACGAVAAMAQGCAANQDAAMACVDSVKFLLLEVATSRPRGKASLQRLEEWYSVPIDGVASGDSLALSTLASTNTPTALAEPSTGLGRSLVTVPVAEPSATFVAPWLDTQTPAQSQRSEHLVTATECVRVLQGVAAGTVSARRRLVQLEFVQLVGECLRLLPRHLLSVSTSIKPHTAALPTRFADGSAIGGGGESEGAGDTADSVDATNGDGRTASDGTDPLAASIMLPDTHDEGAIPAAIVDVNDDDALDMVLDTDQSRSQPPGDRPPTRAELEAQRRREYLARVSRVAERQRWHRCQLAQDLQLEATLLLSRLAQTTAEATRVQPPYDGVLNFVTQVAGPMLSVRMRVAVLAVGGVLLCVTTTVCCVNRRRGDCKMMHLCRSPLPMHCPGPLHRHSTTATMTRCMIWRRRIDLCGWRRVTTWWSWTIVGLRHTPSSVGASPYPPSRGPATTP